MAKNGRYWEKGGKARSNVRGIISFLRLFFGFIGNQPTRRARDVAIINKANLVAPYVIATVTFLMAGIWYVYLQSALSHTLALASMFIKIYVGA